jgi:Holliday junction resolvase RusA-like endonuclease
MLEFFMPMAQVPTATHQMKQVRVVNGKPRFYEPPEVALARRKLTTDHLAGHKPLEPLTGPLRLVSKWCFPLIRGKNDGQWKDTKPDTDNLVKLLKDCMTALGFWEDDAGVASEITEKFWAKIPGIYVQVEELE